MNILKGFRQWLRLNEDEMQIRALAVGMNSTVDITKDLHIVMLDYDTKDLDLVAQSVGELQSFWRLSDAEVFTTKNGFHVFFWYDIVPYERLKMIINYAMYVDPMYKYISRFYDHKTIRAYGKHKSDIKQLLTFKGKRAPKKWQLELGSMKREEHRLLVGDRDGNSDI